MGKATVVNPIELTSQKHDRKKLGKYHSLSFFGPPVSRLCSTTIYYHHYYLHYAINHEPQRPIRPAFLSSLVTPMGDTFIDFLIECIAINLRFISILRFNSQSFFFVHFPMTTPSFLMTVIMCQRAQPLKQHPLHTLEITP